MADRGMDKLGGRFETEQAHRSGLPPVPLSRLQRAVGTSADRTGWPAARLRAGAVPRLRTIGVCDVLDRVLTVVIGPI
jgi:hypothetical protein